MRRSLLLFPAVAAAVLASAAPASADGGSGTLPVTGTGCFGRYSDDLSDTGYEAHMRTGVPDHCTVSIDATCSTYTGENLHIVAGPDATANVRLRGAPNPGDLTACTISFVIRDVNTNKYNYTTHKYRPGV